MCADNFSWKHELCSEFMQPYMHNLKAFLRSEKDQRKIIYPHSSNWFHALKSTQLKNVKIVILGQDPYHQPKQAHGLCFSVLPGIRPPPSLINIYKELQTDLKINPVKHGYLEYWAEQGVLLLNNILTVGDSNANSHRGRGWETFTDKVIRIVGERCNNIVFMLWGGNAQKKATVTSYLKHLVLKASHPSPLSAYRGFLGCRHFSQANIYLRYHGKTPIDWSLPNYPIVRQRYK